MSIQCVSEIFFVLLIDIIFTDAAGSRLMAGNSE